MENFRILTLKIVFLFLLLGLSCQPQEQSPIDATGAITLSLMPDIQENGRQAVVAMTEESGKVVYQIAPCLDGDCSQQGEEVTYEVEAYIYPDGRISSGKLLFPIGQYIINSCALLSGQGEFIGYVPIKGKTIPEGYAGEPCPIRFSITPNSIVPVEVLFVLTSIADGDLTDIGYEHIDGIIGNYNKLYIELARMIPVNGEQGGIFINKPHAASVSVYYQDRSIIQDYWSSNGLGIILLPDDFVGENLDIELRYAQVGEVEVDDIFVYKRDEDTSSDEIGALIPANTQQEGDYFETQYLLHEFTPGDWYLSLINPYDLIVAPPQDCPDAWRNGSDYKRGDMVSAEALGVTFTWICLTSGISNAEPSVDYQTIGNGGNKKSSHIVLHHDQWMLLGICGEGAWPSDLKEWIPLNGGNNSLYAKDELVHYNGKVYQSIIVITGAYGEFSPEETPLWNYVGAYH